MRIALAAVLMAGTALAAATVVSAQPAGPAMAMKPAAAPAAAPGAAAPPLQTYDVPMTGKPQTVYIVKRIFKPGEHIGFHTHPGAEVTQVISGSIELSERGHPTKVYKAGDSFTIPRGTVHDPKNVGTTDAQIAVTYVLDKGAELRTMVP